MQEIWINLNHPCYEVDLTEARNEEDARILWGQGYVPFSRLKERGRKLWLEMAEEFDVETVDIDWSSITLDNDNPDYIVLPSAPD